MLTLITYEARRKPRDDDGNETQQPTSSKISCMGRIKHHTKKNILKNDIIDASTTKDTYVKNSKYQRISSKR